MEDSVYQHLIRCSQEKHQFAVLVDPDNIAPQHYSEVAQRCNKAQVDYIFVGGSLLLEDRLSECLEQIKSATDIPVILFPGSTFQINEQADALLFLSLISGRNPELLIGQQVKSAPLLYQKSIEVISTGYLLVEGGKTTTASYMSNSTPIPSDKPEIAASTALAGQYLGMDLIYMDAGSGAEYPISVAMIEKVKRIIKSPLVVGGGICTPEKARKNCQAGADIQVVGNAIEQDWGLITEMSAAIHEVGKRV